MQVSETNEIKWSEVEKQVAQQAFQAAYERETVALIQQIRDSAGVVAKLEDIWQLHDFLSARRHELDGKYDYDYSSLILVFARLIQDGWLNIGELQGLEADKLSKVAALSRML
jgi:hypothetical protein